MSITIDHCKRSLYTAATMPYTLSRSHTGIAQMDNSATDFEKSEEVTQQATTTFFDEGSLEMGVSSRSTHDISTYVETFADIKAFLMRPVLINSGQWTTSQVINTALGTGSISSLLSSVSMWSNKIQGFNLIRGDFMLKVQINASPFQQGKLLLHYLPAQTQFVNVNPKYGSFKNKVLTQKIQHPHIEIDCRKTSVVMRIPYIAPTPWYAMKEAYYDWGSWYLDVFSPLLTGAAAPAGELYVDYLVYGWFENVELNAPLNPQSSNKEVVTKSKRLRRGGEVTEAAENTGPITMGLRKASKIANVFTNVPIISEFAKPVEWVTNIAASVASILGWSKPRELNPQIVVAQQLLRYAGTVDGPDLSYPGGVSCLNRLETIDYGSFTTEDEMSLAYLYQVPYYKNEISWSATAGQGTSLLSILLSPLSILNTDSDTVGGHTTSYEYHVPFTYLSRFHKFWRGSIIVTLKIIKTQMHSGRLQVTWIPCNNPDAAPGITNSSFTKRAIIDIRTEDTISLELPYLLFSDYTSTLPVSPTLPYSGELDIVVLNDLRAPESCSQSVAIQIFYSAGQDFELAGPSQISAGSIPYVPQSDGKELIRDSIRQGMDFTETEIGGVNSDKDNLFHAKRCIGEKTFSVKSYLLRNSVINCPSAASFPFWSTKNQFLVDPYFISCSVMRATTGVLAAPDFGGDLFSLIAPCYAFMRGGMRYTFIDNLNPNVRPVTNVFTSNGFFGAQPYTTSVVVRTNYFQAVSAITSDGSYPLVPANLNEDFNYIYQHIPFYNRLPMALTSYYNGVDQPTTDPGRPLSTLAVHNGANFSDEIVFQRAVADDFQLMFFTGCPPLATAYS